MPTLTIIAGPNGSGKSTLTKWNREALQETPILDPDAVKRALREEAGSKNASDIDAARFILSRIEDL